MQSGRQPRSFAADQNSAAFWALFQQFEAQNRLLSIEKGFISLNISIKNWTSLYVKGDFLERRKRVENILSFIED